MNIQTVKTATESKKIWTLNTFVGDNISLILYGIIAGAVLLQQFPQTEPAVAGFFWGSILSLFFSTWLTHEKRSTSVSYFFGAIGIQLAGVCLQLYLIIFHWDALCALDEALKLFRTIVAFALTGGTIHDKEVLHLLPGRALFILLTFFVIRGWAQRGRLFARPQRRLW